MTEHGFVIEIGDVADDVDAAELEARLHEYNFTTTGYRDGRSLCCFVRDDDGELVAGLDGFTWGGYAKVVHLWVDEAQRGRGLGSALLEAAEREARVRNCALLRVDSHSFQAPDFYRSRGYEQIAEIADTPAGHGEYFFVKRLDR
jgi:ribosomal protein S18 acetylase RimI-like enzyme